MTRMAFLGTPEAAVPVLEAISAKYEVGLVVTQPDRPRGRSGTPQPGSVKTSALGLGLAVAQPESSDALHAVLSETGPYAVGVVVAYGRILRPDVLDIPQAGMVNVHFSLLPRWRGAAPVNRALIEGDSMTGVTIIKLDEGLDTGPVLTAQAIDIHGGEDAGSLTDRLARLGARLLVENLDSYLHGDLVPVPQTGEGATYASKLTKSDRELSPEMDPTEFVNRVRGLSPVPGATLSIDGQIHKIFKAEAASSEIAGGTWEASSGWPEIGLRDGSVRILSLQAPGRMPLRGEEWVRGRQGDRGRVAQA